MATHSSPGACGPQSMGLQRVGHDLVTEHTHTHTLMRTNGRKKTKMLMVGSP